MQINKNTWILALVLSGLTSVQLLYAQTANSAMKMVSPPYIARTSNFMALAFQFNADEAQKLLPAAVKIKSDDHGLASGGMEIYTTDQIYGVPWLADGNQTEVVSFQVRTGENKVLLAVKDAKIVYSQVSSNVFSYGVSIKP